MGTRGFYWSYLADDIPFDDRWCTNKCYEESSFEIVDGPNARNTDGKPYVYRYHDDLSTIPEVCILP